MHKASLVLSLVIASGSIANAMKSVTTSHTTRLHGEDVAYDATVGSVEVLGENNARGQISFTAYTRKSGDGTARPVTFAFNGGPGSSSVWLHLGVLGPKRIDLGEDGLQPSGAKMIDNQEFPIETTDLVMIDPIGTGYSRARGNTSPEKFQGAVNDVVSIGSFIQNYLRENHRETAPKFILGESYGGARSAMLANYLQSKLQMKVDGVVMISPALNFASLNFGGGSLSPFIGYLPSYAAIAWYHKKVAAKYQHLSIEEYYQTVKRFANGRYLLALNQGNTLSAPQKDRIAQQMSEFIGLPKEQILADNLRVDNIEFILTLFAKEKLVTGFYEGRATAPTPDDPEHARSSPADDALDQGAIEAIEPYLRELGIDRKTGDYNIKAKLRGWAYPQTETAPEAVSDLVAAMRANPDLKILIAGGYFDMSCPPGTVEHELSQIAPDLDVAHRVKMVHFEGGHMHYRNPRASAGLAPLLVDYVHEQTAIRSCESAFR